MKPKFKTMDGNKAVAYRHRRPERLQREDRLPQAATGLSHAVEWIDT